MWTLLHTPWCKSWVVHSANMTIRAPGNTKYTIAFNAIKQRPSWLMWRHFEASSLGSFCPSAVCCQGNPRQTRVFTPDWPLEEEIEPKNLAKAVRHGHCCCLRLTLPPSFPCLVYRGAAGGCGQPSVARVRMKYLLAKVFILKAKYGHGNEVWELTVKATAWGFVLCRLTFPAHRGKANSWSSAHADFINQSAIIFPQPLYSLIN